MSSSLAAEAGGSVFRHAPARPPAVAANAMVATSQPLATRAGLRVLERGGNAVDAAVAAAAVLCVAEPMATGIGGDCFALVWKDGTLTGLDAAGPAALAADPDAPVATSGPASVTLPGAVAGWAALCERHGTLGLDSLLADAVDAAERGVAAGAVTAAVWAAAPAPRELGPPPRLGQRFTLPELGSTLRLIADEGAAGFYEGSVARAVAGATLLTEEELRAFRPRWVEPLRLSYRGVTVCELPAPTQGVAALAGLGLLALGEPTFAAQVECVSLGLEDALAHVRDGVDVSPLLEPERLEQRRRSAAAAVAEPAGGTVYLCAVDGDGTAVSFIQSLFDRFGSGVVAPGTGVCLHNRGACFAVGGRVEPGRRPFHTIIPGLLLRERRLLGPFGVMGAFIQAQAHVQLVSALVDDGLDPQAALDRPRFRVERDEVALEEPLWERAPEIEALGRKPILSRDRALFGGGQAIVVADDVLLGGSDARKDGYAAGF